MPDLPSAFLRPFPASEIFASAFRRADRRLVPTRRFSDGVDETNDDDAA